jgi:hypothetical protein
MTDFENEEVQAQTLKKPKTAYIHFCNDIRNSVKEQNDKISPKEILSKLGELWQELKTNGGDAYKKYVDMADKDKCRYQQEKTDNPNIKEKPRKKKDSTKTEGDKKKKTTKEKLSDTSEKVPRKLNGYLKFLQSNRDEFKSKNSQFNSKQITSELAAKWRELTDEDKQKWKES